MRHAPSRLGTDVEDSIRATLGTLIRGLSGPDLPSRFTPLKGSAVSSQQSAVSINADGVLISLSSWPLLCGPLRAQ